MAKMKMIDEIEGIHLKSKVLFLIAILASVVCIIVYMRALSCGFVNYEDPEYVINNPVIRHFNKDFWYWAFTTVPLNFWVPLLWISYALDYYFWGLNPLGYHLTNLILHAINTGFVVFIADRIYRMSPLKRYALLESNLLYYVMLLLAALLFGIHPARVESVVWITERKDVLNGLFTFASIYCYLQYVERKEAAASGWSKNGLYIGSVTLFLVSLTAKPGSIFIPLTLLIMDWFPLDRFGKNKWMTLIIEKLPYVVLALPIIAASIIGRVVQGGYNSLSDLPFTVRLVAAGNSILEYFNLMLFPVDILPYYHLPRPIPEIYILKSALVYVSLLGITCLGRKKFPWIVAIILSFVITLFPALHFFADGYQVMLAPRYTYLASLLPVVIISAMVIDGYQKLESLQKSASKIFAGFVLALLGFYSITTYQLIGDWKNSNTLWSKVIDHQPLFEKAYFFHGEALAENGYYIEAVNDFTTCISLSAGLNGPTMYNVYAFRGDSLMKAGYYENALVDFNTAISLYPHPLYFYYRGILMNKLGRVVSAGEDFKRAGSVNGPIYWIE